MFRCDGSEMGKPCGFSSQDRGRAQRSKRNARTEGSHSEKVAQGIVLESGPALEIQLDASTIQSGVVDELDIGTLRETLGHLVLRRRVEQVRTEPKPGWFAIVCSG
jgi:hypothetical protein